MLENNPVVRYENSQQHVSTVSLSAALHSRNYVNDRPEQQLLNAGRACMEKNHGKPPQLIVVVLPSEGNTGLYMAVKQYVVPNLHGALDTKCWMPHVR